jgi:hypothetical protein
VIAIITAVVNFAVLIEKAIEGYKIIKERKKSPVQFKDR